MERKGPWRVLTHWNNCLYTVNLQASTCSMSSLIGIPNENEIGRKEALRTDHLASDRKRSHHSHNYHLIAGRRKRKLWKQLTIFVLSYVQLKFTLTVWLPTKLKKNSVIALPRLAEANTSAMRSLAWQRLWEPWRPCMKIVERCLACLYLYL